MVQVGCFWNVAFGLVISISEGLRNRSGSPPPDEAVQDGEPLEGTSLFLRTCSPCKSAAAKDR